MTDPLGILQRFRINAAAVAVVKQRYDPRDITPPAAAAGRGAPTA
jgi:hypothetical protein